MPGRWITAAATVSAGVFAPWLAASVKEGNASIGAGATAVHPPRRLRPPVNCAERLALDVPIADIRRVPFDIERERPATLVVVPMSPRHEPQVVAVPIEAYEAVASALVLVGKQIYTGPMA